MEFESDKEYHRKAIALLICFFIAFIYAETILKPYTQKGQNPPVASNTQGQQTTTNTNSQQNTSVDPQSTTSTSPETSSQVTTTQNPVAKNGIPNDVQIKSAGMVNVSTKSLDIKISLLGGRIKNLELKDYKATLEEGAPGLSLIQHSDSTPYPLGVYVGEQDDVWVNYKVTHGSSDLSVESQSEQLILEGQLADGKTIRKTLTFQPSGFLFDIDVEVVGASQAVALEWNRFLPDEDSSLLDPYNTQGFIWYDGEKGRREAASDMSEDKELGNIRWVSLADKYFSATLIGKDSLLPGKAIKSGNVYRMRLSGSSNGISTTMFTGPKSYELLKSLGHRLELNIDFGKLALISAPLLGLLVFLYGFFGNYGLAIVTLTLGVRLLLYPLNSASFKQMKKMQDLKPEMDRIREQYPDRQEQQMQLMAMYKKHSVNPVGGCLPMVLQMPIFFGLYSALMLAVELRHAPFALWITDLSAPEELMIAGFGVPIMVILFVISMVVQQATTPTQMDPAQKRMMMIMPVVLGFMFMNFPSGLTLYWLTSNLVSIGQQKGLYWAHDGGKSALQITLAVSASVFVLAFVATLI